MKYLLLILLCLSCAKDEEKILDTSFLTLGKPGSQSSSFSLEKRDYIHVLELDQDLMLLSSTQPEFEISNFEYDQLEIGDLIVGNGKDNDNKYLLKVTESLGDSVKVTSAKSDNLALVTESLGDSVKVTSAKLSDLAKDQKSKLEMEFTPAISSKEIVNEHTQSKKSKVSISKNVIEFSDYTLFKSFKGAISSPGFKINKSNTKINVSKTKNIEVTIKKGRLEIIPTFRGEYDLGFGQVNSLDTTIDAHIKYKFEIEVKSDEQVYGNITFPLTKPLSFPIRFAAGPVPIYVDVIVDLNAGINLGVGSKNEMTYTIESEYALNAGTHYSPKEGATFPMNKDYLVKSRNIKTKNKSGIMSAEFFLRPKIQTLIYRTLGPYAYLQAGVTGKIEYPLKSNVDDVFIALTGGVGASVHEPIFKNELLNVKSPVLFNLSKGWDLVGPKSVNRGSQKGQKETRSNVDVDSLDNGNKVALKLKNDSDVFTKVKILKMPRFGRLVYDKDFESNGIVHYFAPKNFVEGEDSFKIQHVYQGRVGAPKWVDLKLSNEAKAQTAQKVISISELGSINGLKKNNIKNVSHDSLEQGFRSLIFKGSKSMQAETRMNPNWYLLQEHLKEVNFPQYDDFIENKEEIRDELVVIEYDYENFIAENELGKIKSHPLLFWRGRFENASHIGNYPFEMQLNQDNLKKFLLNPASLKINRSTDFNNNNLVDSHFAEDGHYIEVVQRYEDGTIYVIDLNTRFPAELNPRRMSVLYKVHEPIRPKSR